MKTAICVIIKDEQDYLKEWLDYHLEMGIDEIYLYEDYGSLSHSTITNEYGSKVHIASIDDVLVEANSLDAIGAGKQAVLFDWFTKKYKNIFDWVLFIDIDEFLILKMPLQQLLEEYADVPGLWLKWKFYGANGHIKKPEGKVIDNFKKSCPTFKDFSYSHKSFVNTKYYTGWSFIIHYVDGGVYPLTKYGIHKAYINHYFTKSWEEWKYKILSRGDVAINNRKLLDFFYTNPDLEYKKDELLAELQL